MPKVFIPVTDEMLYERPELITAPLRPYQSDHPCFHWMAIVKSPASDDEQPVNRWPAEAQRDTEPERKVSAV